MDGISKCDVNTADVTLRGNTAAVTDWLYPVGDPEPSGPLFTPSFILIPFHLFLNCDREDRESILLSHLSQ